jgi:hypothetical protein
MPRICYITANYGNYEQTCKQIRSQTIPFDCICFTDNPNMPTNGWELDITPYHLTNRSPVDNDSSRINSIDNNKNTFNIAKYYKQSFQNIPRLKEYDVVVWLDGTVEIINPNISEWLLTMCPTHKIITWEHEWRRGSLWEETKGADFPRYTSTNFHNQPQPYQDIFAQYAKYIDDGYDVNFFKNINFGVWLTCFVAFNNKDSDVSSFLNLWYLQTLQHTTQDQLGFPYVVQKTKLIPYTLPDSTFKGERPHDRTDVYIKHNHQQ